MTLVVLMLVAQLIAVYLMGLCDRLRGDDRDLFGKRIFDKFFYGAAASCMLGHAFDWASLAIIAGMVVGMSIGWGNAIGPALRGQTPNVLRFEWWQRGVLARNAWAALAARGALWGLCVAPAAMLEPRALLALPAYTLAMPLAVWLTNRRQSPCIGNWEDQERYRGWIAGAVMFIGWWAWELFDASGWLRTSGLS